METETESLEDLIRDNTNISEGRKKTLRAAFEEIDQLSETYGAPKQVQDRAKEFCYRAFDDGFTRRHSPARGKGYKRLAKIMFYYASKPEEDFLVLFNDLNLIDTKGDRKYMQVVHGNLQKLGFGPIIHTYPNKNELIVREYGKRLDLDQESIDEACLIVEDVEGRLAGANPATYAAAALYIVGEKLGNRHSNSGHPVTMKTLGDVTGVSEGTIRKHRNIVRSLLEMYHTENGN